MRSAVFLDRDGVLNRLVVRDGRAGSPRTLEEFELLPGVDLAVDILRRASLLVVVVTNQPDVARGFLTPAELERMHECLGRFVSVDAIYTCSHDDEDACPCRKPKPGLLLRAAQELQIPLRKSFLIGDTWKDIEAGKAAGCTTFLINPANKNFAGLAPDFVVSNLPAAVEAILGEMPRG